MKLLINTSNLSVGGGMQVAISFINELKEVKQENEYYIFLSQAIANQIDQNNFLNNFHFYIIEKSPASLKTRIKVVKQLDALEEQINPDVVFSIFTPTYWRPKTKHVSGFALGWLTNPKSKAFNVLSLKQKIKRTLDSIYKTYYVKRDPDYYVVETEDVKEKLHTVLNIDKEKTFVVGNTYSSEFDKKDYAEFALPERIDNEFRLVTIAHNYPHKNIQSIREVLPYLQENEISYKFFVTIDDESYKEMFTGFEYNVINLGPVESKYCPSLYAQCDALFLPTLLESFTASYPEAMKMKKPILTSNLSFAHAICQDAALYFDPLKPKNIAEKIIQLSKDKKLQQELVKKGTERLEHFETAESRARKYIKICKQIIKENK